MQGKQGFRCRKARDEEKDCLCDGKQDSRIMKVKDSENKNKECKGIRVRY